MLACRKISTARSQHHEHPLSLTFDTMSISCEETALACRRSSAAKSQHHKHAGIAWFRSCGHRQKAGIMSISCWLCSRAAKSSERRASITPSDADTNGPSPASAVGNAKGQHHERQLWVGCARMPQKIHGEESASRASIVTSISRGLCARAAKVQRRSASITGL